MISSGGVYNSTMTGSGKFTKWRLVERNTIQIILNIFIFKNCLRKNSFNLSIYLQKLNNRGRTLLLSWYHHRSWGRMWYNTSQLSLLLKECGVIKPLYRKKWNVILKCWFALNTYHMLRNEFPVYSSISKDGEDLTSKKLTTTTLFWKWTLFG